jgi:Zn-dependent peptidase ImmA (M78 family)
MCYDLRQVARYAEAMRNVFHETSGPVDVDKVVEALGGTVLSIEKNMSDRDLKKDYACIIPGEGTDFLFIVKVSSHIDENFRKFIISHELGHLFLHLHYIDNSYKLPANAREAYARSKYGISEDEANHFAHHFLMPKDDFEKLLNKFHEDDEYDIKGLAEYLQLPTNIVLEHGKKLKLIYLRPKTLSNPNVREYAQSAL